MGNESSKKEEPHLEAKVKSTGQDDRVSEIWKKRFNQLTNGEEALRADHLLVRFGRELGGVLWKVWTGDTRNSLTVEEWFPHAYPLFSSSDAWLQVLRDPQLALSFSANFAGCRSSSEDCHFIQQLIARITEYGSGVEDWNKWKHAECPRILDSVQRYFVNSFMLSPAPLLDVPVSTILTPFMMWFLRCGIPVFYLLHEKESESSWDLLYSSASGGLSSSRFESSVFGYRSATITFFRTQEGIFAVGCDSEWRNSGSRFGGADCWMQQLAPSVATREHGTASLYCNLKLRTAPLAISWKHTTITDNNFTNVLDIEVWACGPSSSREDHMKLKQWQRRQTDRHAKVPLPGQWDADKTILEMAGFTFSNEPRHTEYERR